MKEKEEFLFICGVEGMGHQMMLDVLSEYLKGKKNIVNNVVKGAFSSASFPYGQPRNAERRPNISKMVENTPKDVDLKILLLYRDPRFATYSAIRRGFTKNVIQQCEIVDTNLNYIQKELKKLNPKMYKVLRFEKFIKNPHQYTKMLTSFLNITKEQLEEGYKKIKTPNSSLKEHKKPLNKFFQDKDYNFFEQQNHYKV